MAQLVGCDVGRQPGLDQVAFEAPAGGPGGQGLAPATEEKRIRAPFCCLTSPPHRSDTYPSRIGQLREILGWNHGAVLPYTSAGTPRNCSPEGSVCPQVPAAHFSRRT